MSRQFEDITGQTFGYLTVIGYTGIIDKNHNRLWECKCKCGNTITARANSLKSGKTKSCGCYAREVCGETHSTHHGSGSKLYITWCSMKARCNNKNNKSYDRYGGRGIKISPEWEDFEAFRKWSLANGFDENAKGHECTLDRIDNNGPYSPENCRWTTPDVQSRNKRNNRYYTINGETMILKDWARRVGADMRTVCARLNRGWSIEDALFKPIDHRRGMHRKELTA